MTRLALYIDTVIEIRPDPFDISKVIQPLGYCFVKASYYTVFRN